MPRARTSSPGEYEGYMSANAVQMPYMDRLSAEPPTPHRLQQAKSSLEVEYAVLSEANAKNAELQAMLRNSQPLLWLDNALVMQRQKPHHIDNTRQVNPRGIKPRVRFEDSHSDHDAEPVEIESDLRHRRRVQWEVAKRIARVEREITKQPIAQRSWHVKEKKRAAEEAKPRQDEELQREKQRREQERHALRQRQEEEKMANKQRKATDPQARRVEKPVPHHQKPSAQRQEDVIEKVPRQLDFDLDFEWRETKKPNRPAQVEIQKSDSEDEDKENGTAVLLPSVKGMETSPDVRQRGTSGPEPADADDPHQELLKIARESFEDTTVQSPRDQEQAENTFEKERSPVARHPPPSEPVSSSSLGRQVLSEYRTMPTPVSFGVPPLLPMGASKRLNSDILRRLFSDLDADRDGHLNRIETCMALHRLQIDVPAPRIVSFFKHIHDAESSATLVTSGRPLRRTATTRTHEPLKQVINYKQFAAFVTAAFEQQQQQRGIQQQRRVHRDHDSRRLNLTPLQIDRAVVRDRPMTPSPSLSAFASARVPPPLQQTGRATVSAVQEEEERAQVKIVERNEQDEELLTDRVLRQLPDHLMVHALAMADTANVNSMQQVVRRSLEKIAGDSSGGGNGDVDDQLVNDVAQDLLHRYVTSMLTGRQRTTERDDDTSGLGRAGVFFESLQRHEQHDDVASGEDARQESDVVVSADWWRELTKEQVGALVHEVWNSRQVPVPSIPPEVLEEASTEDEPSELRDACAVENTVTHKEKATEMSDFESLHVQRVAEKAVQTGSAEWLASAAPVPAPAATVATAESPPPPPPTSSPPPLPPSVQSALARAVFATHQRNRIDATQPTPSPARHVAATTILADLRRQRRHRQRDALLVESVDSTSSQDTDPVTMNELPVRVEHTVPPVASTPEPAVAALPSTPPLLSSAWTPSSTSESPRLAVKDHRLQHVNSPATAMQRANSIVQSSSSSSGIFSSSSASTASHRTTLNLFRQLESDSFQRRRGLGRSTGRFVRQTKRPNRIRDSVDSSEVGEQGNDQDDFSEGEITRAIHADLSDGELFGSTRRKAVRRSNYRSARQNDTWAESYDELEADVGDSVESGEMLPSMIHIQRAYHRKLIASSVSSLESGEAEDGVASLL